MEEQVTTIEQSQRLWALGVPEQRASMRWGYCDDGYRLCVPVGDYSEGVALSDIPAFTVADLMELVLSNENIKIFQRKGSYFIKYKHEFQIFSPSLRDGLFEAAEFLVKNIYVIP